MTMLIASRPLVIPTRVLFDATAPRKPIRAFAASLVPLTTEEIGQDLDDHFRPFIAPVESCKTIEEWDAEWEAEVAACMAAQPGPTPEALVLESLAHLSAVEMTDEQWATWRHAVTAGTRKYEAKVAAKAEACKLAGTKAAQVNSFDLSGAAWTPRVTGYTREDLDAFAAGRLITLEELLAREEAEEELRLLANQPAEIHEEMTAYRFEA
jgi:hypothetical protein